MIKFTLLALLCFSISDEILGGLHEDKVGRDGYHLELRYDDNTCCKDLKHDPDASPEEAVECLNSKNSKLVAEATLQVLYASDHSYESIKALKIPEFMVGSITYQEWADNVAFGNLNFKGMDKLRKLVTKYVLCKKVCKVFFYLRESLREHASTTSFNNEPTEYGRFLKVSGDLIVLSDVRKDIELNFLDQKDEEYPFAGAILECKTLIIDSNLIDSKGWAGKLVQVDAENVIVPKYYMWNLLGNEEEGQLNGEVLISEDTNWDNYEGAFLDTLPFCTGCNE